MAKTKQENKKKFVLALLIILLLALAVGYAAFTDVLTISGTAKIASDVSFDLQFTSDSGAENTQGCTASAVPAADGSDANDKLVVSVQDLAYPGAGAQIRAVIKNVGTVPAKLTGLTPTTPITGNTNAIKIEGLNGYATGEVIQPNATCTVVFTVYWDPEITTLNTQLGGENGSNFEFTLGLTYEQETTPVTVTNTHTDA